MLVCGSAVIQSNDKTVSDRVTALSLKSYMFFKDTCEEYGFSQCQLVVWLLNVKKVVYCCGFNIKVISPTQMGILLELHQNIVVGCNLWLPRLATSYYDRLSGNYGQEGCGEWSRQAQCTRPCFLHCCGRSHVPGLVYPVIIINQFQFPSPSTVE